MSKIRNAIQNISKFIDDINYGKLSINGIKNENRFIKIICLIFLIIIIIVFKITN